MTETLAPTAADVRDALAAVADPADAEFLQRFFKTGPGQYGEGDVFIGVRVPQTRAVAKRFAALPLAEVRALLDSPVHEHRLAGLIILNRLFALASRPAAFDDAERTFFYTAALATWGTQGFVYFRAYRALERRDATWERSPRGRAHSPEPATTLDPQEAR